MGGMSSLLILRFNNTILTGEKVVVFCFFGSEVLLVHVHTEGHHCSVGYGF